MFAGTAFIKQAIRTAEEAYNAGEVPVGAVIVDSTTQEIIAIAGNLTETLHDPTAHAEMLAIREACRKKGSARIPECDLYVSLEPCPMCAQAIAFARLRRVYFSAYDPKGGGVEHGARIFSASSCHHIPEVYGGILEQEAAALLQRFFRERR